MKRNQQDPFIRAILGSIYYLIAATLAIIGFGMTAYFFLVGVPFLWERLT